MKAPYKYYRGKQVRFEPPDREWLFYHYWTLNESSQKIADMVGARDRTYICNMLKKFDVPIKPKSLRDANHSKRMSGEGNPAWNGGTASNYHARLLRKARPDKRCAWCGATENVEMHHKDHNRQNGSLENLEWLCYSCNHLEAYLNKLKKDGRAEALIEPDKGQIVVTFLRR